MKWTWKQSILVGLFGMLVGWLPAVTHGAEVVIAYSTPSAWANWGAVLTQFTKETGIQAPSDLKTSGTAMAALIAEKDRPQADAVYFGISYGIEAARKGLVDNFKPKNWDLIPAGLKDPNGAWFTIHAGAISFNVNRDSLGRVAVPRGWNDLLKPEYKDLVTIQSPITTFTGYVAFMGANLALGGTVDNWNPGIAYFKKLKANGLRVEKTTSYAKLLKGEITIHIEFDANGYRARHKDQGNVDVVIPEEGSIYLPYVMVLVKGAPRVDNGKKFLDFLMSESAQKLWAEGFVRPVNPKVMTAEQRAKFLPDAVYARVKSPDFIRMADVMKSFQDRWQAEIGD